MQRRRTITNYSAEPKEGFEPPTSRLQGGCSVQTELHRLARWRHRSCDPSRTLQQYRHLCTPGRIRTCDPLIKSQLL